ncbi:E3 ubiquitin-protein ligase RNF213-alpha-like protein [Labeo rohita]|uniref:E3 ubiquitin-protein ligase RNF213-alpha-like protein n=1 Tax=Labeo rohita TaxID=84645 RepID=A0A498NZY8_LABRO|nr:E3 ubiquitin-protein ligase RNF213-alpha-like protein [Labeo rohita]
MCWKNEATKFAKNNEAVPSKSDLVITLKELHSDIFTPCYNAYKNIYTTLKEGSITFKTIDVKFRAYKGKIKELAAEFANLCQLDLNDDQRWVKTRVYQIEQYHELHLAVESAEVVKKVKETFGLQGDFQVLDKLLNTRHKDFKEEHLDSIDDELVEAKNVLVDIKQSHRLCLQELSLRKNFVSWVKQDLRDINGAKVFVDLASISAGENDMEVDRVACFHDAVLGYSSVLYDLNPESDFRLFKETLKKLWKALDNDHNLPKKLRDSARHLEWLKAVKDSHGSVETSSMSLASAINMNGVYVISAQNQKRHKDFKEEHLDSIDDELVEAKNVLVEITEPRRLCLQELSLRKNFVSWVKQDLRDINGSKVFVDLASISAGENDMEVDRVACFHDAVLGYSSVLYDLNPEADFKLFKEMLKKLWKALDNDHNLPKKLLRVKNCFRLNK